MFRVLVVVVGFGIFMANATPVLAANEGVSGTVDMEVLPAPSVEYGYEYVTVSFTSTDDATTLDLTGWTINDKTGAGADKQTYVFSAVTLGVGNSYTVCQTVASTTLPGPDCDDTWGSATWNNSGDVATLRDEAGTAVLTIAMPEPASDTSYFGSGEIAYEGAPEAVLTMVTPAEAGLTFTDQLDVEAEYTDDDDVTDEIVWYVTAGSCESDGGVVLGSTAVSPASYIFTDGLITISVSTETLENGEYCLVVDPEEGDEAIDMVARTSFLVERYIDPRYVITGFVYNDINGDGVYTEGADTGRTALPVTAQSEDGFRSTMTTSGGSYSFSVYPGVWTIHAGVVKKWLQTGVVQNGESIKRVASTTKTNDEIGCVLIIEATDESAVVQESTCDFLYFEDRPPKSNGGGTKVRGKESVIGQVLGVSTSTATTTASLATCNLYLRSYLSPNWNNDSHEVKRLQVFLSAQGWFTPLTGQYDETTTTHVKALQQRYQEAILFPWVEAGLLPEVLPTGIVYKTTRAFINNYICPGSEVKPIL
jgi:hypothetical protein